MGVRLKITMFGMHGRPGFGHPGAYGGYPAPGAYGGYPSQFAAPAPYAGDSNLRQENADLQAQMHAMRMMHAQEITELKLLLKNSGGDSKIPSGFEFGLRVFECMQESPGVGYRTLPRWDKRRENADGALNNGPDFGDVVVADAICQGPFAMFIHCIDYGGSKHCEGWLPIHSQDGKGQIMKHLGKVGDVDLIRLNMGDEKVGQADSYAQGAGVERSNYDALQNQ